MNSASQPRSGPVESPTDARVVGAASRTDDLPEWVRDPRTEGWPATLELVFGRRRGATRIVDQRHRGPLRIQRPFHPEGPDVSHVYLLHPPAGIVGGDDLRIRAVVLEGAQALVTSPGATRFYLSHEASAQLQQVVRVGPGSSLEWLPQETIFMRGARARTASRIDLEGDAAFIGWEILGFGRPALDETFDEGELEMRFELYRDGHPVLLDCLRVDDGRLMGLAGSSAVSTLVAVGADEDALTRVRAELGSESSARSRMAATLIDDLLVVRGVADRCEPLFERCVRVWQVLRPLLLERAALAPRIWLT